MVLHMNLKWKVNIQFYACINPYIITKNKTADLEDRLRNVLINLINEGVTDFYAGGAYGWDMLCEEMVLRGVTGAPAFLLLGGFDILSIHFHFICG